MKFSLKTAYIYSAVVLFRYANLTGSNSTTKLNQNGNKLFCGYSIVNLPTKIAKNGKKIEKEYLNLIAFFDSSKLSVEPSLNNVILTLAKDSLRLLFIKEITEIENAKQIKSEHTEEKIVGDFLFKKDLISCVIYSSVHVHFTNMGLFEENEKLVLKNLNDNKTEILDENAIISTASFSLSSYELKKEISTELKIVEETLVTLKVLILTHRSNFGEVKIEMSPYRDSNLLEKLKNKQCILQSLSGEAVSIASHINGNTSGNNENPKNDGKPGDESASGKEKDFWDKNKYLIIILIFLLFLGVSLGIYIFLMKKKKYITRRRHSSVVTTEPSSEIKKTEKNE